MLVLSASSLGSSLTSSLCPPQPPSSLDSLFFFLTRETRKNIQHDFSKHCPFEYLQLLWEYFGIFESIDQKNKKKHTKLRELVLDLKTQFSSLPHFLDIWRLPQLKSCSERLKSYLHHIVTTCPQQRHLRLIEDKYSAYSDQLGPHATTTKAEIWLWYIYSTGLCYQ